MAPDNERRALAVDLLNQVLNYIKQSTPTRTNDQATQGFVYSVLRVGQMISPHDFALAWSPIGGSPAQNVAGAQANTLRAMSATFNTEQLVDTMLAVTNDGTFETYSGGGRHLGFTYHEILQAMEAPPRSAADQARLDAARQLLFNADNTRSPLYNTYTTNQKTTGMPKPPTRRRAFSSSPIRTRRIRRRCCFSGPGTSSSRHETGGNHGVPTRWRRPWRR